METTARIEHRVTEEQVMLPLVNVLQDSSQQTKTSIISSLNELFPEQLYEEKSVQKTKEILGLLVQKFSQEQLKDLTVEIQYLATSWLDDFEREIFNGLTLKELLHERRGI